MWRTDTYRSKEYPIRTLEIPARSRYNISSLRLRAMATTAWIEKAKRKPKFKVRKVNRCSICGRSRAYIRYFGICRICLREQAHKGVLPGVRKSSW